MKLKGYVTVPEWFFTDTALNYSEKLVLFALRTISGRRMTVRRSQAEIAQLCGCSRATVAAAIKVLAQKHYIKVYRRWCYSPRKERIVYAASGYRLLGWDAPRGFTLVPRSVLNGIDTPADFIVAVSLYRAAGRKGRCWPSLRLFAETTRISKATVCRSLRRLVARQVISRLHCRKEDGSFSCNSYYPVDFVRKHTGSDSFFANGGLKFRQPLHIRKDNEGFYNLKEKSSTCEFGEMYKNEAVYSSPYIPKYDGTGALVAVGVTVDEEEFLF